MEKRVDSQEGHQTEEHLTDDLSKQYLKILKTELLL
jgi:hypothetical protein